MKQKYFRPRPTSRRRTARGLYRELLHEMQEVHECLCERRLKRQAVRPALSAALYQLRQPDVRRSA